ncbi:MAG TPA: hydroxymethylbilane synthase, partial [Bacteroidales bacterium]|nr:hydroxymethylbilane synthase [Bacteroidales bacterium]
MNTLKSILIGTRGSKLALWQSNIVKQAIEEKFPNISVRLEIIQTTGDKILDVALSKIGDKNLFTKEIEHAMLENRVDIAVHSLKDLPTELPQGLCIGAVLPRAECRDALVSNNGILLHELNSKHIIGTSSLRRKAQLLAYNPHLHIEDVRGNIDTRLQKLASGQYD